MKAMEYYEKSSELGNSHCMYNLGLIYNSGKYGNQDLKKAIEYFEMATERNNESRARCS